MTISGQFQAIIRRIYKTLVLIIEKAKWNRMILILLILLLPYIAFHNLDINPRTWQDEGAYLSVAKSISEYGVYAVRNSNGYQTFGPIQSVGPTVIVPIAIGFKIFGAGLMQGRTIIVIMSLITTVLFYLVGKELFGSQSSTLGLLLLLGSPAAEYLLVSRQVLGENVAIGYFLGGFLLMLRGLRNQEYGYFVLSGIFFGAAMVTKAQFIPMTFSALFFVAILDVFYYRLGASRRVIVLVFFALLCVVGWWVWQYFYFGPELFLQNTEKLNQLSQGTGGASLRNTIAAIRFLAGTGSGHFYYFWGLPALIYVGLLSTGRDAKSLSLIFLLMFCLLWICYFLFWINPWPLTVYVPMAISALFVGKLWFELNKGIGKSYKRLGIGLIKGLKREPDYESLMSVGTVLAVVVLSGFVIYNIQRSIKVYVIDQIGLERSVIRTPLQLSVPHQTAKYLMENVNKQEIIETWERELWILTDLTFHYPDQSYLGDTYGAIYRNRPRNYVLGDDYFRENRPGFLVIGWFARSNDLYDMEYISQHAVLIATFGTDAWRYDVYKLNSLEVQNRNK